MVLGIDAGGTKTEAAVIDKEGQLLALTLGGPGSFEAVGLHRAMREIKNVRNRALALAKNPIQYAFYALASYDRPYDLPFLMKGIREIVRETAPFDLQNDSVAALKLGLPTPYGMALCAGTGSICIGRGKDGTLHRIGGLGRRLGDIGSAEEMAEFVLKSAVLAHEGRGRKTALLPLLLKEFALHDGEELIDAFLRKELTTLDRAKLLKVFFEAVEKGDGLAKRKFQDLVKEMAQMVQALYPRLQLKKCPLVLAGGLFRAGKKSWQRHLPPSLPPTIQPIFLKLPPVLGACLLALEKSGSSVEAAVVKSWKKAWEKKVPTLSLHHIER